jgi:hypothetical protein
MGDAMWADLEYTYTHAKDSWQKGKAAFELFTLFSLGRHSTDISLQDALHYVTSAALLDYSPALIVGKRLFEANCLPVPEVFHQKPQDIELHQHIQHLESLPPETYYASAIHIFWKRHIRKESQRSISQFCQAFNKHEAQDFFDWVRGKSKEMDRVAFQQFAKEGFLFHQAINNESPLAVSLLLGLGCDVDIQTPDGITPLHFACRLARRKVN